jgi:DNA mismatch endonuclease (patch repair protein)
MRRVRHTDTSPEKMIRALLFKKGYRYRKNVRSLPGKPDIVFKSRHKIIFIHGCFWHLHRDCNFYRLPRTRRDFWMPKLEGNRKRDTETRRKLRRNGWKILVAWECELRKMDCVLNKLIKFLGKP